MKTITKSIKYIPTLIKLNTLFQVNLISLEMYVELHCSVIHYRTVNSLH